MKDYAQIIGGAIVRWLDSVPHSYKGHVVPVTRDTPPDGFDDVTQFARDGVPEVLLHGDVPTGVRIPLVIGTRPVVVVTPEPVVLPTKLEVWRRMTDAEQQAFDGAMKALESSPEWSARKIAKEWELAREIDRQDPMTAQAIGMLIAAGIFTEHRIQVLFGEAEEETEGQPEEDPEGGSVQP